MKRWAVAAAALGAYAAACLVMAPATLVDAALERASLGRLRLAEAQGTVWSGSGRIELRDEQRADGLSTPLAWRIAPLALLRGRLSGEMALAPEKPFPVALSLSGLELSNAELALPASVLGLAAPKLAPLRLTGELRLRMASLLAARERVEGSASMRWLAAGSALTPVAPLGDYEVALDAQGGRVQVLLRTLQGPLQLDGKGAWAQGARPAFLGTARVPPQHLEQLAPLLRLIAIERGEGSFELRLQ